LLTTGDDIQILIKGCLENNRKAQEKLYKRFFPVMMPVCMRYVRDRNDAFELLNDAFLKVFKHLATYDLSKALFHTWMKTIVINTAIDRLRRQNPLRVHEMLTDQPEAPGIENEAVSKMSGDELLNLIRQLPVTTRLVFNLYSIDGYSHREIASVLGISDGTSRWHLSDARRQLKGIIHSIETST
jgi:RNA polymerase sigma factor (sigma-70 family)